MQDQYALTAQIKGLSRNFSNTGPSITLDWKLPDSTYDLMLSGKDGDRLWEEAKRFSVGDTVDVIISKGNLKNGKEGNKTYDYYWNMVSIAPGNSTTPPASIAKPSGNGGSQDEFRRGKEEMRWTEAVNNAVQVSIAMAQSNNWDGFNADTLRESVTWQASLLYDLIISGPPQNQAPDAHQKPVEEPEQAAGSKGQKPTPNPVAAVTESVKIWNISNPDQEVTQDMVAWGIEAYRRSEEPDFAVFDIKNGVDFEKAVDAVKSLDPVEQIAFCAKIANGELAADFAIKAEEGYEVDDLPF